MEGGGGRKESTCPSLREDDLDRRRSSVVTLTGSEFRSDDPGLDPMTEQDERQFFCLSESTMI